MHKLEWELIIVLRKDVQVFFFNHNSGKGRKCCSKSNLTYILGKFGHSRERTLDFNI
jgi:hypothetical protein